MDETLYHVYYDYPLLNILHGAVVNQATQADRFAFTLCENEIVSM